MRRRSISLIEILIFASIYPLLFLIITISIVGTGLLFNFVPRISEIASEPTVITRSWRWAVLPTAPPATALPVANLAIPFGYPTDTPSEFQAEMAALVGAPAGAVAPQPIYAASAIDSVVSSPIAPTLPTDNPYVGPEVREASAPPTPPPVPTPSPTFDLDLSVFSDQGSEDIIPSRSQQPTFTPTPAGVLRSLVSSLISAVNDSDPDPKHHVVQLPPLTPTSTDTTTPSPMPTPTATATPTETPLPLYTPTPTPSATPTHTITPLPTDTPMPPLIPTATATPDPTVTPVLEYDYMLAEFFNSPTTNSFLMVYVAIVDPNEIPIGDMKIVGFRQDHNLTYESPLSTWYYEGYSAPGEVIKSGNVKFEPPGGIESTSWVLHLEDAHSNRQSEDVSFDVDINDKQWYFIKFRRKY